MNHFLVSVKVSAYSLALHHFTVRAVNRGTVLTYMYALYTYKLTFAND